MKQIKGRIWSQSTRALDALAYAGWLPGHWGRARVANFWERQAAAIHQEWGRGNWDFPVLSRLIQHYQVTSVLDIGCGSGRLFGLYQQLGVTRILGVDIATEALAIAKRDYPEVATHNVPIEDIELPANGFDLIISNRVLQHITPAHIDAVIDRLCSAGRLIYLNELADSDSLSTEFFMVKHDYEALFHAHGWQVIERGSIGNQSFLLLQPASGGSRA